MSDHVEQGGRAFCPADLEWEFSDFPVKLSELEFEKSDWGYNSGAWIEISRTQNFRFSARIFGNVQDVQKLNEADFVGSSNVINGQRLFGKDEEGNGFHLSQCCLTNFTISSVNLHTEGAFVQSELEIKSVEIDFVRPSKITKEKNQIRLDWFICSSIPANFSGQTIRSLLLENKKIRIGVDSFEDTPRNYINSSISKDFIKYSQNDLEFFVAKVPRDILKSTWSGICLEFRGDIGNVSSNLIIGVENLISFLLGNRVHYLGHSILEDNKLLNARLISVSGITSECSIESMPPIRFNLQYDWGNFGILLNQLLPEYLLKRDILALDAVLERYWTFFDLPLGANLPVLSSALEILAEKYLKTIDHVKTEYINRALYQELIEEGLSLIADKIVSFEGADIVLSKIKNAHRKGPNEKMTLFYSLIGITLKGMEKKALQLRNQMAHGIPDYSLDKKVQEHLILTRVYQVLFNKTILQILGYRDYYIDYSIQKSPVKNMSVSVGEKSGAKI